MSAHHAPPLKAAHRRLWHAGLSAFALPLASACMTDAELFPREPAPLGACPDVVIFDGMYGYVHDSAPVAVAAVSDVVRARRGTWAHTDDNDFVEVLGCVPMVVFAHANGGPLRDEREQKFREWVEGGGDVVLLHGAVGDWWYPSPWWTEELIGARFVGHTLLPNVVERTARIHLGPLTDGMPHAFDVTDEIYSFTDVRIARDEILVEIDAQPIAWTHSVGTGRVTVMALGHTDETWRTPWMRTFLENVLGSATRRPR